MSLRSLLGMQISSHSQSASTSSVAGSTSLQTNTDSHSALTSATVISSVPQSQGVSSNANTDNSQPTVISGSSVTLSSSTASSSTGSDSRKIAEAAKTNAMIRPSQNTENHSSSIPFGSNVKSMNDSAIAANTSSTTVLSSSSVILRGSGGTESSLRSGASPDLVISHAPSGSKTSSDSGASPVGDSIATSATSSAALSSHSTRSVQTASSLNSATSTPAQAKEPNKDYLSQASDTMRSSSRYLSIGGDSTLSTFVSPVDASGSSSQAAASSGGVQKLEANMRLAASTSKSLSNAGDDIQAHSKPGARPAATNSQPKSTTGVAPEQLPDQPHPQSPKYKIAVQSTLSRYQHGSASGEQSAIPSAQSNLQSEGSSGQESANGLSTSSSKPLYNQSALVTSTNAQGSQVVYMVLAAVIRVPVRTTNAVGKFISTESLLTAAATASANIVITSIIAPGSTVFHTSQVPAVIYTTTNSQGAVVVITSALIPSSAGSMASTTPAPGQNLASPEDDHSVPDSPPHDESGHDPNNGSLGNADENSGAVSKPIKHAGLAEEVPQSNADASS